MKSKVNLIGITLGDPAGIGPEVIAKSLKSFSGKNNRFLLIGDEWVLKRYLKRLPPNTNLLDLEVAHPKKIEIGKSNKESARASLAYLKTALKLLEHQRIHALVTAPVSKDAIHSLRENFDGHTEYIADYFHIKKFGMMFVAPGMRVVVVTRHIALKDVSKSMTPKTLNDTILLTAKSLVRHFDIKKPAIAVCGLNPHAGEKGRMGKEEIKTLIPVIARLKRTGFNLTGPLSADTLFYPFFSKKYDCVIAMYHDQGLSPIKALYFNRLVNFTMGLPFIRTSPAHGTAFDIAGKNKADPSSMLAAIQMAAKLSR